MTIKLADLRKQRATAFDAFKALAEKPELSADETADYGKRKSEVVALDGQIERLQAARDLQIAGAQPVAEQEAKVEPTVENDKYVRNKALILGGAAKMLAAGGGHIYGARAASAEIYGASHPVTRALAANAGASGGFLLQPDVMTSVIELLRPMAVVRASGPRVIPMPRGTMTLPGQASAASATYGSEVATVASSQPSFNSIVASYKKLTALVPISNDMMRYASPEIDAIVTNDLLKVIALKEDNAFILGNGTQDGPMGFLYFANRWVGANGGTVGNWLTTAASTLAVNGTDPVNSTGGNFITSTYAYNLSTVAQELGGAINRLDSANVVDSKRVWFMSARSKNYLFNVQNSLGVYVYREEMSKGTLFGYPFKVTSQISNGYYDASGHTNCSFVILAEMDEAMILDSMSLELAVSNEGSYIDVNSNTISAFQNDQTLIRAIAEHDFQMRHDQSVAVIQGVAWAPAIS